MAMDMKDMVAALAKQPEAARRKMIEERLNMFAGMPQDERQKAMGMMIQALQGLPDEDMRKVVKTRTEVLCALPSTTREALMMTHMGVLQGLGQEKMMREMGMVQAIVPELSPSDRQTVMAMMEKMKGGMAMGAMAPHEHRPAAPRREERKNEPWWKFW